MKKIYELLVAVLLFLTIAPLISFADAAESRTRYKMESAIRNELAQNDYVSFLKKNRDSCITEEHFARKGNKEFFVTFMILTCQKKLGVFIQRAGNESVSGSILRVLDASGSLTLATVLVASRISEKGYKVISDDGKCTTSVNDIYYTTVCKFDE